MIMTHYPGGFGVLAERAMNHFQLHYRDQEKHNSRLSANAPKGEKNGRPRTYNNHHPGYSPALSILPPTITPLHVQKTVASGRWEALHIQATHLAG